MLDITTSPRIEPLPAVRLGSSSTDSEDKDYLQFLSYPITKGHYPLGHYLSFDIASHLAGVFLFTPSETYKDREIIAEEMVEHDIYVKMPPKRRRTVKFKIQHIRKAKPRIVIPENYYSDI